MATAAISIPPASPERELSPVREVFSVRQVVASAKRAVERAAQERGPLWVRGEVSNFKRNGTSGHCYFTLKDDRAELGCVMWCARADALPALPENGTEVEVLGRIGVYEKRGHVQFTVDRLDATGIGGMWQVAVDILRKKLRSEGLLDEARRRNIPEFPERVGIVTAMESAAMHDMLRALRRKARWVQTVISPCTVEGVQSAPDIARAIGAFGPGRCEVDVVVVARGGGSKESLWAFNTEPVARAIAGCPYPVVSAVGHETDYTLADDVADLRAATPTAGAERAVPNGVELDRRVAELGEQLTLLLAHRLEKSRGDVDRLASEHRRALHGRARILMLAAADHERALAAHEPRRAAANAGERLDGLWRDIRTAMNRRLERLAASTDRLGTGVQQAARARIAVVDAQVAGLAEAVEGRSPRRQLLTEAATLNSLETAIRDGFRRRVATLGATVARETAALERQGAAALVTWAKAVDAAIEALDARSPTRVLGRGYALVQDAITGRLVRAPEHTAPGRVLAIRLAGGEIRARVETTVPAESGEGTHE